MNQVVAQASPDGGSSSFWYDRLGRLTLSQNARQRAASATENNRLYSYTQYDYLGRITEVGQVRNNNASEPVTSTLTRNPGLLNIWFQSRSNLRGQITQTVYDLPYSGFTGLADMSLVIDGSEYVQEKMVPRTTAAVVQSVIHEIVHTGGVLHPFDDANTAGDVDLVPDLKNNTFRVGQKASLKNIIANIMMYPFKNVEGKKVSEWEPDDSKRGKVSADQVQIISNQIDIDANKKRRK